MTTMEKHETGMFSWADMGTTDVAAAKKFYTALFGWTYQDDPMGPDAFYSRALLDGRDVAAIYPQQPAQKQQGMPPYWASYITVDSADQIAERATSAGGKVLMPPFDVMDAGRMTVVQDPSGAALCAWQAKTHVGARVMNQPGALCWAELMTTNVDAAGKFYVGVFGWKTQVSQMGEHGTYTMFTVGERPAVGMMGMTADMKGIPSYWMPYFEVAGCDQTVATATKAGGVVLVPGTDIPGVGRFAVLQDPQGGTFGVLQAAR